MNLPRLTDLTDLAEFLKTLPANDDPDAEIGFDMEQSLPPGSDHPCGSACCIGGWIWLCNPETSDLALEEAVMTLGPVSEKQAVELCWPSRVYNPAWEATPQQAARAVEILRDTGCTDWKRAMEEVQ
jgi:hypothetical protein